MRWSGDRPDSLPARKHSRHLQSDAAVGRRTFPVDFERTFQSIYCSYHSRQADGKGSIASVDSIEDSLWGSGANNLNFDLDPHGSASRKPRACQGLAGG